MFLGSASGGFAPILAWLILPQPVDDDRFQTRLTATTACWIGAAIGSMALTSALWSREPGLRKDLFALQLEYGIALLFLGTYCGGRELALTIGGAGLVVACAGYRSIPVVQLVPFLLTAIGVVLSTLAVYYVGLVTRASPRSRRPWIPPGPNAPAMALRGVEGSSRSDAPRGPAGSGGKSSEVRLAPTPHVMLPVVQSLLLPGLNHTADGAVRRGGPLAHLPDRRLR